MAPTSDIPKPHDDPYSLVGDSWPQESEGSYRAAEVASDDAATAATTQGESSDSAVKQTDSGMQGKTADSVSGGYEHLATQLHAQSQHFTAISGWMLDAGSKVQKAKSRIANLVRSGTSEIKDAITSEVAGTPVTPSSSELMDKYRGDIASVASKLGVDLDSIGHSLNGDSGASMTPSYIRTTPTSTAPTIREAAHQEASGQSPEVTPHQLPPMPRATTTRPDESPSTPTAPAVATPRSVNPTLSNLIGGQATPTGSPGGTSAPHTPSPNTGASSTQSHQPTEQREAPRPAGLPRIPSLPLDGLPAAAAESVATAVSAATAHQLPTAPSAITPSVPASTGLTPGVSGTPPVTPMTPVAPGGLAPIGGGGLSTPAVTQPTTPAPQAAPAPQPTTAPSPTPPRGPAADATWIQRTYGLAPGIETPKPDTPAVPAFFITDLPEPEAHLHRVLASLRQQFETNGWSQPLVVASIRRGFETKTVYVTADAVSIHPAGIFLPHGVTPLDDMPTVPAYSELSGSLMVTDKLKSLLPRGWDIEELLSTVPSDEQHQSTEQYQELSEAGELLPCGVSRGREGVEAGEAMSVFARVAIGSGGCGELDVESARLRGSRWVGTQPVGYGEVLSRWYLSDAAECMGLGDWGEAVYASERYLGLVEPKRQVA